jgi:hypothetical protein
VEEEVNILLHREAGEVARRDSDATEGALAGRSDML